MAERELEQDLALARQMLRGPEAMKARVRLRLAAEVGPPPNGGLPSNTSSVFRPTTNVPAPVERLRRALRHRPGLATVTVLLGLSFGAGFWLGQHPGPSSPGVDPAGAVTTRVQPTDDEATRALARPVAAAPANPNPNDTGDAPVAHDPARASAATRQLAPVLEGAQRATKPRARTAGRSPGAAVLRESSWRASVEGRESDALAGEVALLERTERAIRKGDAAFALGLLGELDEKFPEAALPEERQAARVLATCVRSRASGEPSEASVLAKRFLAESPASVYAARIREACSAPASAIGSGRTEEPLAPGH